MREGAVTAIVTGGGTGIGRAVAVALAQDGPVTVIGRRLEPLRQTVEEIASHRGDALAVSADVTSPDDVHRAVTTSIAEFGTPDVLVNNAGIGGLREATSRGEVATWEQVLAVNVLGPVRMCAAVVPGMLAAGTGCVVNINSLQGSRAFPGYTAYGASKAALMRLTDGLAGELAGTGVIALDVSPGLVATDITREPGLAALLADVPGEAWTPVEKVAQLVARIARDRPAVLNGRFVHAEDDLDDLLSRLGSADGDARRLRLTPTRTDPLLD
jgi:3-oxoacyl-[acyl-carrier protein] reductase